MISLSIYLLKIDHVEREEDFFVKVSEWVVVEEERLNFIWLRELWHCSQHCVLRETKIIIENMILYFKNNYSDFTHCEQHNKIV